MLFDNTKSFWQKFLAKYFGGLDTFNNICRMLMTFKQVEKKYGYKINTLYSWLSRGKLKEKGFRHVKVGSVNLLEKVNQKKV